jgi:Flp pilus assembly protein TadG
MIRFDRRRTRPAGETVARRRGVAAVEMAVVLPVFVTVIMGVIEIGRGIMVGQLMTNAARESARMAIIDGSTNTTVSNAAKTFLQTAANVAPGDVTVTITTSTTGGGNNVANAKPQDLVTVNLSLPYSKVSWLPPKYLAGKNLTAMAAMRHE